ncbi:sodium ion-translocating decarboxylase subunit beta [bacterium]|nr:sodium ion-translocating decarboxylase subunit beta [bacterium]
MDTLMQLVQSSGFASLQWQNLVMFVVAGVLIYLAIVKEFEPLLLIPIGFGAILANLPGAEMLAEHVAIKDGEFGNVPMFKLLYSTVFSVMPPIIFLGVGALTDFRPLLGRPITFLLGAAAQLGIAVAACAAFLLLGFDANEAASIGIIGGADGPTSIFVASKLAPHLLGPIAVAAYSYMALVPIIQPPIIHLMTTQKEREIDMPQAKPVSRTALILFPIVMAILGILAVPDAGPLLGLLMFGNLMRECGVVDRLAKTAGAQLIDIVTIFLGLLVGMKMQGDTFLQVQSLYILFLGMIAFSFSTFGGLAFAKILNLFLPEKSKINPCIGAAGVSAVPMAARVVQNYVHNKTEGRVNPLMAAMGPNVAGVIGSAVAAGVFLALLH